MSITPAAIAVAARPARRGAVWRHLRRHPTIVIGGVLLGLMALAAVFAPYLGTVDPQALSPIQRLRWPSAQHWFGTDMLGRDIYSRTIYGARVSLTVGLSVALSTTGLGLAIGLVTGFSRWADALLMRVTRPIANPKPVVDSATLSPTVSDTRAP
jgi:peptide/nickel transport system permease protein